MASARRPIDLIGVPFNSAGTTDGVANAPAALRRTGLPEAVTGAGHEAADHGEIAVPAMSPTRDPGSGVIAVQALGPMIDSVKDAVRSSLEANRLPIVVGGDCPVLIGCLAAVAERAAAGLLFVDGHEDAWPARQSTTGEAADMELGWLLGRGVDGLPPALAKRIPILAPDDVVLLGPRDQAELEAAGVRSIESVVRVVRSPEINADSAGIAAAALSTLEARGPFWLHVDLDVLATDDLAAVDYPQAGGLVWAALTTIARRALASPNLRGWTITIYNPDLDPDSTGAERIVRFVAEALAIDGITARA
jgi:arginase